MKKEEQEMEPMCVFCTPMCCTKGDDFNDAPTNCPSISQSQIIETIKEVYQLEGMTRNYAVQAARVEAEGYLKLTRVEELILFSKKLGIKKIGIATCAGLFQESRQLARILKSHGLVPISVCCKVGGMDKTKIGLTADEKVCPDKFEALCNPVAQAEILNCYGTGLNVIMGLCLGHDILFTKYSKAPVTTLVVKDRVLAHNTVAALYAAHSYYKKLMDDGNN